MMTDDPLAKEEAAGDTLPVDLSLSQTAENSETGDWDKYLYMEQEAHRLNLTHQGYPVTLHTQSCVVCHSLFSTRKHAREHFEKQHGGQLFECRFCRLTFVLECNCQQHNELHHGIKLKNSPEILPAEESRVTTTTLENILEGLIDDEVDSTCTTKGSHGLLLNQKFIPLEENNFNDNCMNEEEMNVRVTNGQMNTNSKDIHKCILDNNCGINVQDNNSRCENESVFPNVAIAKRELKFEENKGKEWTPRGIITHRNLYIQRHSKNLKKLRDVILKRSLAKRKAAITIDLLGKNSKKTQNTKVSQTQRKETIPDNIKTTGCNTNKLEQDKGGTESSASESKAVAITERGTEALAAEGGKEAPITEGGTESPTTEGGTEYPTTEGGNEYPTTEGGKDAPITEGGTEYPTTEGGAEALITEGGTEALITEEGIEAPITKEGTEAPITEEGTEVPITEGTEAPITEEGAEALITEGGTEAPITEGGIKAPITEEGTEVPITEGGTEDPITEGGTEAPTTEEGIEVQKTLNDDKALKIEQLYNFDEYPEIIKENVTPESTPSAETTRADASVSRDKKGPLDKDTAVSNQSYSKDSRLWCKHCNISFKNKQTLRKHTVYSLFHKMQINEEPLEREICYDCASTFANKNNLLRHQLLKCYFRNKSRETSKSSKIQLTELSDLEGKANSSETPKKLIPDAHISTWKSSEKNISIDGLSTSHPPFERKKGHTNTSVQHINLVKNLAKFDRHPPSEHDNSHIQNMGLVEQNIVDDIIPWATAASVHDSRDEPTPETLHDTPTIEHSVFTVEDREQTSQYRDIYRVYVPKNQEREGMGVSTETTIERGIRCGNDSTIAVDSNLSIECPGIECQTKTLNKKRKYTPTATTCDGCGAPFASRKNCRRHILNSCTFYKGVPPLSPQNSNKQVIEIPTVDTRKASKRSSDALAPATTGEIPKLHITCEDCGKQFSRRSKYRKHARKNGDLPKIKSEFSKTRPQKTSSKVPRIRREPFQCSKCYLCFLSNYALTMHMERFCFGQKIHCPAVTPTSPTSTAPRKVDSLFEYRKYVTVKCCICLQPFSTRAECYRHLSDTHRLRRSKAIELEREYLRQQIRLKFDFMMNKKISNVSGDIIIPAVNLGLRWKLEAIQF